MPQLVAEEVARFLKQTSLFAILDDKSVDRLASRTTMKRFSLGETIVEEGDVGRFAWLIFSGRVRVLKRSDSGRQVTLGTQSVGEIFGDQAILTDSPRSASVRAAEDVVLFRIERNDFLELLEYSEDLRKYFDQFIHERAVRDFLRTQTFLEKLRAKDVISLLDQLNPCEFPAGETIVREGTPADVMYIVREGQLKVTRTDNDGEHVLGRLSDGDFFGERALLTDEPRSASVVTETATRCFGLSRQHFDRLLETSPAIREQLTERFSRYDASNDLFASCHSPTQPESTQEENSSATSPDDSAIVNADKHRVQQALTPEKHESTGPRHQKLRSGPRWFEPWPWIPQQNDSDCGAASLAMVARYFGIRISVEKLRHLAQTGYAGASLYFMSAAAAQIGFRPKATRTTLHELANLSLPAIAHWENHHFLVVYKIDGANDEILIGDPARGLLKLTHAQFESGWTGRILQLETTSRLEGNLRPDSMFKRMVKSLRNRIPESVGDIKNTSPHDENSERAESALSGHTYLENVSYRFSPDGPDILSGINLELQPGQTVAIVGRSGAGKSLLTAILQGTLTPTNGQVQFNGNAPQNRDCCSPVEHSQLLPGRTLFDGLTIAENIAFGSNVDPNEKGAIITAARLAEADSFISRLPYGYDTPIGRGYALLSAGEGQLLSLARSSLLNAPLLVLDDTLSALPSNQARRILLRLRTPASSGFEASQPAKRCVVVTSRNVAAIRDSNLIAVLDDGHLVETGTHQHLMSHDGLYGFLWREQSA